jgi:uncharacterized protein YjbJ (UPF0337 family)
LFRRDGKARERNEARAMTLTPGNANERQRTMDKDRVKGLAREAKGAVKEKVGKATGDTKTEAEGKAEKAAGKVQNAVGGLKDAARDAVRDD